MFSKVYKLKAEIEFWNLKFWKIVQIIMMYYNLIKIKTKYNLVYELKTIINCKILRYDNIQVVFKSIGYVSSTLRKCHLIYELLTLLTFHYLSLILRYY